MKLNLDKKGNETKLKIKKNCRWKETYVKSETKKKESKKTV